MSVHSASRGVTIFSARSYTYTLPSAPPRATLRAWGVRSKASLLSARDETWVEMIGTYLISSVEQGEMPYLTELVLGRTLLCWSPRPKIAKL